MNWLTAAGTGSCFWSESSRYLTDDAEGLPVLLPFFYRGAGA